MAGASRERLTNGNGHVNGHSNGHHANGNGNGKNGHAAPSIAVLQAEITAGRDRLKALATERDGLALAAVRNDKAAIARIAEIDSERMRLSARSETLESAVRQLHQEARESGWRQFLPRALNIYRSTLIEQRELQAFQLQRHMYAKAPGDLRDLARVVAMVEDFAHEEAHRIAKSIIPDSLGRIFTDAGDSKGRQSATASTTALRARVTAQLADALFSEASSIPFPAELLAVLREANRRLSAAGISSMSHLRPSVHGNVIGRAE